MFLEDTWIKIAESELELDFQDNGIAVAVVRGKKICLGRHQGHLHAFAYKCPHASGIMADGYIDMLGNAVCPLHRYKFNIANGRNTSGQGYFLKTWEIKSNESGVFISGNF